LRGQTTKGSSTFKTLLLDQIPNGNAVVSRT
jgi:hypothetical protein